MNKKKTDIATTHMCKHHFNEELVDDQRSCTISCCTMTSFNLTPHNEDPSTLSSSPPSLYSGGNRSQVFFSENDAKILMLPILPSLKEDEWNCKNLLKPRQMHLKERLKTVPRFHPEGQIPFVPTSFSNMTMAPIPSKMKTTPMLRKDEAKHYSCSSSNESPFSTAYFRPIQFNDAQDSYQMI
jgi:hypothetical protein